MCSDTFLAVILSATEVGNLRPSARKPEGVARIHDVGFFCLNSNAWDETSSMPAEGLPIGSYDRSDDFTNRNEMYQPPAPSNATILEHPCAPLMKILSSGTFYYALSPQWDISSRLVRRRGNEKSVDEENPIYDDRFLWNAFIVRSLLDFRQNLDKNERDEIDRCQFIVRCLGLSVLLDDVNYCLACRCWPSKAMPAFSQCHSQRRQRAECQSLQPYR